MYCREFFRRTIRCVSKKITSIVFPAGLRCRCVGSESGFPRSPSPREGFRVGYDRYSRRAAVELPPDGTGMQPEILSNGRVCNVPKYPVFPVRFHAGASVASRVSREVPPRGRDLGWGMIGTHGVPPWSYRRTERTCSRKSYRTDGFAICCGKEFALTSVKCKLFCL